MPVEKLQLYRFVGAHCALLWCTNVRFIRLVNLRTKGEEGGGGKGAGGGGNEELISVFLNFRCYNDSVESSTMQK